MAKMDLRKLLLISSSSVHGHEYLQYVAKDIKDFLTRNSVTKVLFVPYALPDHESYYQRVFSVFKTWGVHLESIHKSNDVSKSAKEAEAYFVGGGNTFLLLHNLYTNNLVEVIQDKVMNHGVPYIGTSAGTNVATATINTTNDMPIVLPKTFEALNLVPFNINPHYLDVDETSNHMGETREQRILQYLEVENRVVLGMREGVHLLVENGIAVLQGLHDSRLFARNQEPREIAPGSDVSFLLKPQQ